MVVGLLKISLETILGKASGLIQKGDLSAGTAVRSIVNLPDSASLAHASVLGNDGYL